MKWIIIAALAGSAIAQQTPQPVNQVEQPTGIATVVQYAYDGSGNLTYQCFGIQTQATVATYGRTASSPVSLPTLTSIAVSANTGTITFSGAPGLYIGAQITVSGSATVALNATYKVTAVSGSTATITTAGVSNATYNDSTLQIATFYPVTSLAEWAIKAYVYNGSNALIGSYWANAQKGASLICDNRSNY